MRGQDLEKLARAGYRIIRRYPEKKEIRIYATTDSPTQKQKDGTPNVVFSWQRMPGIYRSKAAMHRAADELLEDEKTIEA